jgi:arylsulfatase
MGSMSDQQIKLDSYAGYLTENAVTIAEVLSQAGYDTYTSGKWHVGDAPGHRPLDRGFDHCFSFLHGASSYFTNLPYRNSEWPWSDGTLLTLQDHDPFRYPDDTLIYATDLYTDHAIRFTDMSRDAGNPFFIYLAYTAPHWPLHALPEDIEKYRGRFHDGWDSVRIRRYRSQLEMGIVESSFRLSERDPSVNPWAELTSDEKLRYGSLMEVYAAMIDRMDQNIGRLIRHLESNGQLENTVIFFLSDNGASRAEYVPYLHERFSREAPPGTPDSFTGYGAGWANASNTPFRLFKATVHEGGIATPFIAWNPSRIGKGIVDHTPAHIVDLMPTCLSLVGASYPVSHQGNRITPLAGVDLIPLFSGIPLDRDAPLFFEHHGNEAIRRGTHKLVKRPGSSWEMYQMDRDRTETENLISIADQAILGELLDTYYRWRSEAGVFPYDVVKERTIVPTP